MYTYLIVERVIIRFGSFFFLYVCVCVFFYKVILTIQSHIIFYRIRRGVLLRYYIVLIRIFHRVLGGRKKIILHLRAYVKIYSKRCNKCIEYYAPAQLFPDRCSRRDITTSSVFRIKSDVFY